MTTVQADQILGIGAARMRKGEQATQTPADVGKGGGTRNTNPRRFGLWCGWDHNTVACGWGHP